MKRKCRQIGHAFGEVSHWYGWACRKGGNAQVGKLNVVAQKRSGKPKKWDEVLLGDIYYNKCRSVQLTIIWISFVKDDLYFFFLSLSFQIVFSVSFSVEPLRIQ